MKHIKYLLVILTLITTSCEDVVEGLNDDPNKVSLSEYGGSHFLTGVMLANISTQVGHLNRISGMWTGQLIGFSSLYSNIYGYNISTVESNSEWNNIYIGMLPQIQIILENEPENKQFIGICKVLQANAIGTGASLFGDIPYAEASIPEIDDPKFDNQITVIDAAVSLLDEAITALNAASETTIDEDIHFNGDPTKWKAAAYTLKARYLLIKKDYNGAYSAALNGIQSSDDNLQFVPRGVASVATGDKNLFWQILAGSRNGDLGNNGSYLLGILDPTSSKYRGHSKTNETARFNYYKIDEKNKTNDGIISQFEPQNMVAYQENKLTLAETAVRVKDFGTALTHLNEYRTWLNNGGQLNAKFIDQDHNYEAFVESDFAPGGLENADNIDKNKALLREIIEERYISGFGTFMPFDDARRIRVTDPTLVVPFPLNTAAVNQYPERFPYAADELNSNSNAPEDPGIFQKTPVNAK